MTQSTRIYKHSAAGTDWAALALGAGLYVMNAAGFSDEQVAKWLKVAATMGQRLQGKAA
jgi:hypothetical protein